MSRGRPGRIVVRAVSKEIANAYRKVCDDNGQYYSAVMEQAMMRYWHGFVGDGNVVIARKRGTRKIPKSEKEKVSFRISPEIWAGFKEKVLNANGSLDTAVESLMRRQIPSTKPRSAIFKEAKDVSPAEEPKS